MFISKIACPQCQAVLKTNRALPAGQKVKCPACGARFATDGGQIQSAVPAVPAAPAPAIPVAMPASSAVPHGNFLRPGLSNGFPMAQPAAQPATPVPSAQGGPSATVLTLVIVGGLLFVGGGIALVVACFSGRSKDASDTNQAVDTDSSRNLYKQGTTQPRTANQQAANNNQQAARQQQPSEAGPRSFLTRGDQVKVNQAIDRAVAFLKSSQKTDGTWPSAGPKDQLERLSNFKASFAALPGLTLLECGIKKDDLAIQKAARYLRSREEAGSITKIITTYDLALTILFLDRLDDPKDKALIRKLALRLVAGQSITGGWTYYCPELTDGESAALDSLLHKHKGVGTSPLDLVRVDESKLTLDDNTAVPARVKALAVWRSDIVTIPNQQLREKDSDNSNTQFAILALWAAKKHDLPFQRTLALIVKRFRKGQDAQDGSWGYLATGREMVIGVKYPTMTCAGLLGLAVGLGLANEARATGKERGANNPAVQDKGLQRGLAVVAGAIGNPHQPWEKPPLLDLYFLWSVERVGVIYNLPRIGDKDWYGWGAEILVANQTPQGNWDNGQYSYATPTINTCFALLFLKRANLARDLTNKLQLGD